ncbi:MAG: Efflux ABC transporter, permease protein, partial [uncultured Pseudonocardia sp.]
ERRRPRRAPPAPLVRAAARRLLRRSGAGAPGALRAGVEPGLAGVPVRVLRAGVLPARDGPGPRLAGGDAARPGRLAHLLRGVHRAGPARRVGHERRGVRLHVQRLLQAQVRQALRRDARHPAGTGRRRARRDRLGADPWRPVLAGVPGRDGRVRPARLAVGAARPAGRAAGGLRVRRRRHGGHVVHALVAGLRPRHPRGAADVPVLHHVLPAVGLPAGAADRGAVPAALPRRRVDARAHDGSRARRDAGQPRLLPGDDRDRGGGGGPAARRTAPAL